MFIDDLAIGKRAEKLVAAALAARGHIVTDVSGNATYQHIDIDFTLESKSGQKTTLEVKNDLRSAQTGNIFIETYNENNHTRHGSGWYCYCEADYLAFVQEVNKQAHIISMNDLINYIENHKPRTCRSTFSAGYIIPITELKQFNSYFCLPL